MFCNLQHWKERLCWQREQFIYLLFFFYQKLTYKKGNKYFQDRIISLGWVFILLAWSQFWHLNRISISHAARRQEYSKFLSLSGTHRVKIEHLSKKNVFGYVWPSRGLDQPVKPQSLIKAIAIWKKRACLHFFQERVHGRLWSCCNCSQCTG